MEPARAASSRTRAGVIRGQDDDGARLNNTCRSSVAVDLLRYTLGGEGHPSPLFFQSWRSQENAKAQPKRRQQLEGHTSSGFSLIELLIVVAIILIIAAIAIPNLIRARIAANQASAVESCRTVTSAEVLYNVAYENGFAPTLDALGGPAGWPRHAANAQLIDEALSSARRVVTLSLMSRRMRILPALFRITL